MEIRELIQKEIKDALKLAWSVFQKFEAPEYSKEGNYAFYQSIHDPNYVDMLKFYGAFDGKKLIGTLATRNQGGHIALFFVDEKYHKKGIGTSLFEKAKIENTSGKITVNSSPYAVPIYHHLGFLDIQEEQSKDGIRYTPMVYQLIK